MKFSVTTTFRTFETEYKEQQPTILDALNKQNRTFPNSNINVFNKDSNIKESSNRLNNIIRFRSIFRI